MGQKKKRCKNCGQSFSGEGAYCSEVCKMTAYFSKGNGDTSKPNSAKKRKVVERTKVNLTAQQKEEILAIFKHPLNERWGLIRELSEEGQKYAKKIEYKMLKEEEITDRLSEWEVGEGGDNEFSVEDFGDSDDGSI